MVCFREGRTETVRPCTMEACAFVRSMRNPAATVCKFSSSFISLFEPKPVLASWLEERTGHPTKTRVSPSLAPFFLAPNYFQAPVEVASKTLFESCSRAKMRFTVFCFFIASPTAMILVIHVLRRFFFLWQKSERKELFIKAAEGHVNNFKRAMSGEGNFEPERFTLESVNEIFSINSQDSVTLMNRLCLLIHYRCWSSFVRPVRCF